MIVLMRDDKVDDQRAIFCNLFKFFFNVYLFSSLFSALRDPCKISSVSLLILGFGLRGAFRWIIQTSAKLQFSFYSSMSALLLSLYLYAPALLSNALVGFVAES